jgi:hypothetical protein
VPNSVGASRYADKAIELLKTVRWRLAVRAANASARSATMKSLVRKNSR